MKTSDLDFQYPESLIATRPQRPSRVLLAQPEAPPLELAFSQLVDQISAKDLVVINDTKVMKKRVFAESDLEILFLDEFPENIWTVLMPSKKLKVGDIIGLPSGAHLTLLEKGLPQKIQASEKLDIGFFEKYGHMALPPYIQKVRGERKSIEGDEVWYQTEWARKIGSSAAPTASLHFSNNDWKRLEQKGVGVVSLTLHVGLGTFLPVHSDDLEGHTMHSELVEISKGTLNRIARCKAEGGKVWALGTTVTRALESWPKGFLKEGEDRLCGGTDIFIKPGFEFEVVDVLMTNFHQPKSTLLALVAAFAGLDRTLQTYQWAIKNNFRLFSYGDLSVWTR